MSIKKFLDEAGLKILQKNHTDTLKTVVEIIDQAKADIDSPNFTGNPTAPTPDLNDNSNKIATTAYIQNALGNTVIITITPALSGIKVTLTNQNTSTIYSGISNALGQVNISIKEYGTYNIEYNNPNVSSIKTFTASMPGVSHTIAATYLVKSTYTVKIDLNNSNPLTCCEYQDAAYGMTKGSSEWDNKPIFNSIRPCVFQNGKVRYYLDPNNFNHKIDGTDAILTGEDGDVMIEFGKFAYRIYTDEVENCMYVSITNDEDVVKEDPRYHYYAFMRNIEGDVDHFYYGAFKGSIDNENKLRSIIGVNPTNYTSMNDFVLAAHTNGEGYSITNYTQLVALQCLYLIKYGNLNSQEALGNGHLVDNTMTITGQTLDKGMYYGTTADSTTQVKFAGIEDMWGNIWEWISGIETDSSFNILIKIGNQIYTFISGLIEEANGYITKVIGTTEGGFMNIGYGGSSNRYFCDYSFFYPERIIKFGGAWNSSDLGGIFCFYAYNVKTTKDKDGGGRLSYT